MELLVVEEVVREPKFDEVQESEELAKFEETVIARPAREEWKNEQLRAGVVEAQLAEKVQAGSAGKFQNQKRQKREHHQEANLAARNPAQEEQEEKNKEN